MNKEWSELNKNMQTLLKKESTYKEGTEKLLLLRNELMKEADSWQNKLSLEDYSAIPFLNANGYHSKTVAYSLWHIFRIEDIVANTLIQNQEEVLFSGGFLEKTASPIITTGNELKKMEIAEFSKKLDIPELYEYIHAVKEQTDKMLCNLCYKDLKKKFSEEDKEHIKALNVISTDENAFWLIDYWCGKDNRGLIQMPFSRHWIMHIEAALRIIKK